MGLFFKKSAADPDVQRMLAFQKGSQEAFRELFETHRKPVINFCRRFCRDNSLAEDLAQEVFLRVYRGASGYRPQARFTTWLYRIAVNVCLNETRSRRGVTESLDKPVREGDGENTRQVADDQRPNAADMAEAKEREEHISRALALLPEPQRIALMLRTYHEFSYTEIASQMSCSEAKVKTLIFRARQAMREALKDYL